LLRRLDITPMPGGDVVDVARGNPVRMLFSDGSPCRPC